MIRAAKVERPRTTGVTAMIVLAAALSAGPAASPRASVEDPGLKYRDWLDLVAYHIQPVEKDVFLKLTNDGDRDVFIAAFWRQRDPTPGTPVNEYRDELLGRFAYVNQYYGRGATRQGWRTDMGRTYMILGPPASVERFEATIGLVPCVAWSYAGDAARGLPPQFNLLFYQRGGIGEFKLYDPVADGPARLLVDQKSVEDPFDYNTLYEQVRELAPTLAELAITRIPGEYNYDLSPSPRNALLLADILGSPKKDVNPSYATHFLNYKGLVSAEYLTNYVECWSQTALLDDPVTGLRFLHVAMVPSAIDVDEYAPKGVLICHYQINISLRRGEDIVFQYAREFPLEFPMDSWETVRASGLAIEESFPIAEGDFKLTVLLTNTVGKQFSLLEEEVAVPPVSDAPAISGFLAGYRIETYPHDVHIPFKVLDRKLAVDPRGAFASAEPVILLIGVRDPGAGPDRGTEVRIDVRGLRQADPVRRSYAVKLDPRAPGPVQSVPFTIPAGELEPDYYEIAASLMGGDGQVLDDKKRTLIISPAKVVGHPVAKAKGIPLAGRYLFRYMLGEQLEKTGRPEEARASYAEGYRMRPDDLDGVVRYANLLLRTGAFDEALKLGEDLRRDERRAFALHTLRGQALYGLGRWAEALDDLALANRIYDSDTAVLNTLGKCYLKLGRRAEARGAFNASLRLDPGQAEIRKLAGELAK